MISEFASNLHQIGQNAKKIGRKRAISGPTGVVHVGGRCTQPRG